MNVYEGFARVYATGDYPEFSRKMAEVLPDMLGNLGLHPQSVLDLACGEGAFAIALSELGYTLTGYDRSERMLEWARKKANSAGVDVGFKQGDMREIPFRDQFDLVTSWYDSVNYMLTEEDLWKTFSGVHSALHDGGAFIFDMNTLYSLSVMWQERNCYVQRNDDDVFEVHRTDFDEESEVATLEITAFVKKEFGWERTTEMHKERAYPLKRVREVLRDVGFQEVFTYGNPTELTPVEETSGRVWFVARKISTR